MDGFHQSLNTTLRTAKTGKNAGNSFWGCTKFPDCKGITSL